MPSAFGNSPTKHIIYITGPAGCGKTTVAKAIAEKLDMTYVEGDDVSQNRQFYMYSFTLALS